MNNPTIRFNDKCIEIISGRDYILVKAGINIEIRERVITINGGIGYELKNIKNNRKKVIYIFHRGITSNCSPGHEIPVELSLLNAHVKYTETSIGGFLTIVTSGSFLIDYIIVNKDTITIIMPGRKEAFVEQSNNTITVYIV
ncbi:MAG: hypothetical protein QXE81_02475 [Desulfurococcaceae archaeon]